MWYEKYDNLDFCGGNPEYIQEDNQDMMKIHFQSDVYIDVGYLEDNHSYYITTIKGDNWVTPVKTVPVTDKNRLLDEIQKEIFNVSKFSETSIS